MAQSTATTTKKRTPNPILIGDEADSARIEANKNVILNYSVHPALANLLYSAVASIPANVLAEAGKVTLKRPNLTAWLRDALAEKLEYTGERSIIGSRGGNVVGIVTMFKSNVQDMFSMARMMGQASNMGEDQIKQMAFAQAKMSVQANEALKNVVINDDVLEAIWTGKDAIGIEDDEEEEEEEEE